MRIHKFEDLTQAEFEITLAGQSLVVSVFLIDGMLIDTGPSKVKEALISLFDQWEISEVVLTHHHEDHTGLASYLQKERHIPIYIHEMGIPNAIHKMKLPLYRKVFWGEREPFQPVPLEIVHRTPKYTWDVIHTPGHAHDHVALYNREKRWMFGGDLFVQPTPKSLFAFESVPKIIESLQKILTYDFDVYICSHAGVILSGREAIEEKLDYLIGVQVEVLALYEKGTSPCEIQKRMFPKRHPMQYFSLFENSPRHIVNSILSPKK